MHTPNGSFKFTVGEGNFEPVLQKFGGKSALTEWKELNKRLQPIMDLAIAIPPLALRSDIGFILTLLPYLGRLLKGAPVVSLVEGSFKDFSKNIIKDKFLENWFEFLSFALSGLPANGTIAAAVAYTMRDLHQRRAALDYPLGGSGAVIDALIRGIEKNELGHIYLRSHVKEIIVENNKATGVRLLRKNRDGSYKTVKARKAVISNASVWNTLELIPKDAMLENTKKSKMDTPMTGSFVHLYLGINSTGLPSNLESHYTVINKWDPIDAPQNHVIISIPSVLDPSLAPPNCHVIHAYAAANEVIFDYLKYTIVNSNR